LSSLTADNKSGETNLKKISIKNYIYQMKNKHVDACHINHGVIRQHQHQAIDSQLAIYVSIL
jgi:hypothetical protein